MFELKQIVIPKIKACWRDLAEAMRYDIQDIDAFEQDGRDTKERCQKLLTSWLRTDHDPKPKTYQTLLKYIKKVGDLSTASGEIEKELIEGKDK